MFLQEPTEGVLVEQESIVTASAFTIPEIYKGLNAYYFSLIPEHSIQFKLCLYPEVCICLLNRTIVIA